jgi:uncharacterized protein (TIGR03435 family)
MPVYYLVAAKNGPKLPASKDTQCIPADAPPSPPSAAGRTIMTIPCGRLMIGIGASGGMIKGGQIAMPELTRILSTMLRRPITDKTGFAGTFDVELKFAPDLATAGLPSGAGGADSSDTSAPTIFMALQENLGLRLESAKGPVETLIIDHVERPSAN